MMQVLQLSSLSRCNFSTFITVMIQRFQLSSLHDGALSTFITVMMQVLQLPSLSRCNRSTFIAVMIQLFQLSSLSWWIFFNFHRCHVASFATAITVKVQHFNLHHCPDATFVHLRRTRHRAGESTAAGSIGTNMPRSIDGCTHVPKVCQMPCHGPFGLAVGRMYLRPLLTW